MKQCWLLYEYWLHLKATRTIWICATMLYIVYTSTLHSAPLTHLLPFSEFLNLVLKHLVNLSCSVLYLFDAVYLWSTCFDQCLSLSWGRILGRNQDKSLNSFPPCYLQSHLQLCLDISFSSNSHNLLNISSNSHNFLRIPTVQLLYTVKKKWGKPDRKAYPLPHGSMF